MQPHDTTPLKRCTKCDQEFPATTEYFHKDKSKPDGLVLRCKSCVSSRGKHLRDTREERMAQRNAPVKTCTICGKEFPATLEYFYADNRYDPAVLRSACKPCANKQSKDTRDQDKLRAYGKKWAEENREKRRKACREWRARNLDTQRQKDRISKRNDPSRSAKWKAYRLKNQDKISRTQRKYKENNREKLRIILQRYVARKASLPNDYKDTDWQFALDYFHGCCAYCGRPPGLFHMLAMDHFVPISSKDCPGTIPANIVPACHQEDGCNNSKHDRDPNEWVMDKFGKRRGREILDRIHLFFSQTRPLG